MKIKNIKIQNYKAISSQNLDLNGASVIVMAGNNKGKTSALRGLIDRFRGEKPEIIVKEGEEKGFNRMELTDGSKIDWKFTKKGESFSFTTADDIKMTTGVLSAIGKKYFGERFSIDDFLKSSKAEALKMVQKLLGIDLSELEAEHKVAFDKRTIANAEIKRLRILDKKAPEVVTAPDIEGLKKEKEGLKEKNTALKAKWEIDNTAHQKEATDFNNIQAERKKRREDFMTDWKTVDHLEDEDTHEITAFIDLESISRFYDKMKSPEQLKEITSLNEPKYNDFVDIDAKIETAIGDKAKFDNYETDLKDFNDWREEGNTALATRDDLNDEIGVIAGKKLKLIKKAKLPADFEMTDEGLFYKGLPLDDNQISSSAKYICALKLGVLVLGKIRTMHFDASTLDKQSLAEIQEWAIEQDLQLLIERPEWDGGEIKYDIIEN